MTALPHEGVWVRLKQSATHGVGVFAIRTIPKGTLVFATDALPVIWFSRREIERRCTDKELLRLYTDFCVLKDGKFGCPTSFNVLTPGWYLNEPLQGGLPNVQVTDSYDFVALRSIRKGEELTIDYRTVQDIPGWQRFRRRSGGSRLATDFDPQAIRRLPP